MSLIIQLLIISVVGFIIQGEECDKIKTEILDEAMKRSELENNTVHLFCVANSLQDIKLNDTVKETVKVVPQASIDDDTKKMLNVIFNYFSYQCKNFTIALTLKHLLLEYLFHQTDMTVISQYIEPLHSILVYLQTMANILDDMELNEHSRKCVRLTAAQYKMMYYVRYGDRPLLKSLIHMEDWTTREYHGGKSLSTCNCEILHPSILI